MRWIEASRLGFFLSPPLFLSLCPSVPQSQISYLVYDIADKSVSVGVSFE